MDPISQLGWGNRHVEVDGAASQLVRDVFVAADRVHKNAMSEVGGFMQTEVEWRGNMEGVADGSHQSGTEGSMYAAAARMVMRKVNASSMCQFMHTLFIVECCMWLGGGFNIKTLYLYLRCTVHQNVGASSVGRH